ncbi:MULTISPECIES: hypothetical protein [Streptococcus]|uniref:Uncharacterized protein n=1 Tax=Streptococcus macedonicus TaxID=59310 RepID=A0AA47IK80_STRMC|nr:MULTISPECIES: hypothetical protein [Streptococcus]MBE6161997.1 hypothetical protein [Streptococcus equinus]MCW8486629.1 hypothetical protein [Streptococcus macedonicus]MCW8494816.1 hypothetical protein [Streptococcus macedonicus]MCW8500111.1 hypothetical protein [Streptococcus macedonicus]MCW8502170.1 hypothetical protein [Streptococcus macedonicus]
MTSIQVKFDVVSSMNLENLQSLIETISRRYQLIHLDLADFNKTINDCEITLVISSQDDNVKNFSDLQDLLRKCLKNTSELDQIEDDFDNQNIKTLQEAWKIIINDLAENIIEWIEEEFEGK